jgi:hypothetical protein
MDLPEGRPSGKPSGPGSELRVDGVLRSSGVGSSAMFASGVLYAPRRFQFALYVVPLYAVAPHGIVDEG